MSTLSVLPLEVQKANRKKICDAIRGPHLYFRHVKDPVQARLHDAIDFQHQPSVFLFGNPHIDNYARTNTGIGMIDFDSAMDGPYLCDLFSLMLSVQLRREDFHALANSKLMQSVLDGYLHCLNDSKQDYQIYQPLAEQTIEPWRESVEAYIAHGKKWAKKLTKFPIATDDPIILNILSQYYSNLNGSDWQDHFRLVSAGHGVGSMGRLHHLIVLQSLATKQLKLIDIKHTRNYILPHWPHHQFYHHHFDHDAKRMIAASQLHAPGVSGEESYATYQGVTYWGCELPIINLKIKGLLSDEQAREFSFAVGTQIGKSHAQSAKSITDITAHLAAHQQALFDVVAMTHEAILQSWERYVDFYQKHY